MNNQLDTFKVLLKHRYQSQVIILLWRLSILKEKHRQYLTNGMNQMIALEEMNRTMDKLIKMFKDKDATQ